jgi:hypothetical protein
LKAYHKSALFIFIGALLGFGFYYFIGCRSGSCPISGNPFLSTGYGALMGFLFYGSAGKKK